VSERASIRSRAQHSETHPLAAQSISRMLGPSGRWPTTTRKLFFGHRGQLTRVLAGDIRTHARSVVLASAQDLDLFFEEGDSDEST